MSRSLSTIACMTWRLSPRSFDRDATREIVRKSDVIWSTFSSRGSICADAQAADRKITKQITCLRISSPSYRPQRIRGNAGDEDRESDRALHGRAHDGSDDHDPAGDGEDRGGHRMAGSAKAFPGVRPRAA